MGKQALDQKAYHGSQKSGPGLLNLPLINNNDLRNYLIHDNNKKKKYIFIVYTQLCIG